MSARQESPGARRRRRAAAADDASLPLAFYGRISLLTESNQTAVERQERLAREWAAANGREIGLMFVDESISALRRKRRPGFDALCDAIRSGAVRAVITYHPDRLTRNTRELEDLIDLLDEHSVTVLTVTAGKYDLTNSTSRMSARVVGAVATQESEHKAERVSDKHEELARLGLRAGGPRPFGYADTSCSAVRADEAALVREAFERITEEGWSARRVGLDWAARGISTVRGKQWTARNALALLRSSHLKGVRTYYGAETPGMFRAANGTLCPIEPILTAEEWSRLQTTLGDPEHEGDTAERKARKPAVPYLLTGLVFDDAGALMRGGLDHGERVYATLTTRAAQVSEIDLDEIVTARFLAWLARAKPAKAADAAERAALESEAERLGERRKAVRALWRSGAIDADELAEDLAPLNAALDEIRARLSSISAVEPNLRADLRDPKRARAAWLAINEETGEPILSTIERRDLLKLWRVRVDIGPRTRNGKAARLRDCTERVRMEINGEILR